MSMSAGDASKAIKQVLQQHYGKGNVSIKHQRGSRNWLTFNIGIRSHETKVADSYGCPAKDEDRETVTRLMEKVAPEATFSTLAFFSYEDWAEWRRG